MIVVDGGSGCNRSLAEEIMLRVACKKGSVVDGCLRDLDGKNVAFLGSYSLHMIIPPRGPLSVLCVVVVTTSA